MLLTHEARIQVERAMIEAAGLFRTETPSHSGTQARAGFGWRRASSRRGAAPARRLRVCQMTPSLSGGGVEERIARLLASMDREAFDLSWVGFGEVEHGIAARGGLGIDVLPIPRTAARGVEMDLILRIARVFARLRPDVVHIHNWSTSLYGIAAARLAGVPTVFYGEGGRDAPEGPSQRRRALMRALAPHVDRFTAVCGLLGREIQDHWAVTPDRVEVIPNGIDLSGIDSAPSRLDARRALGIPSDAIVVGALAGRFRAVKRLPLLVEAVGRLARTRSSVHLLLVGDPLDQGEHLRALAKASGLEGRFSMPGHVPRVASVLNALDIVVNCSSFEGASNALLEAMGAGRAVVATAVGGTPEAIEHGVSGWLVPSDDPERLCAAIESLVDDPALRVALGSAARRRVEARFTHETMFSRYVSLYREAGAVRAWPRRVGDLATSLARLASGMMG